ncbi:Competence protein A [Paraliobacillus sp. PM-2]|uniref:type IV pilus biogenesis protein PilM n=1 Tax=Paraliobacillus sp. PM-2 TaxID=1462524 RepID=UPI00061CD7F3|nr:pilus assembly protein PilM [Paraliobacillus sp. PM-2]CQR48013.1 Competence protein A [Paraliobacillus sp. PM-2]
MKFFAKYRVNLSLTDSVIRYFFQNKKQCDYGEIELEPGIVEDGKIIDRMSLIGVLKGLVNKKKWKNKEIAFCVPDAFVTLREELVPKQLNKEEVKKYILLELGNTIRLPFDRPVIDYTIIGEEADKNKILLIAYPQERLDSYKDVFEQANLKLVLADLSFLSVYRLCAQRDLIRPEAHLLNIQWRKSDLVLTVFHNHQPIFNRHVYHAASSKLDTVDNKEFDRQTLQNLIDEQLITIERFMDFYQYSIMNNEAQITDILLSGDFLFDDLLKELLQSRFNLSVYTPYLPEELPLAYAELYGLTLRS